MADTSSLPLSNMRVLAIALPVVLSNATVPVLGLVDTYVIGQLGDPVAIGAVAMGAVIITSIFWMFGFLRMGTTGLTAQAVGQGDAGETTLLLTRALMIGLAAGGLCIAVQWPLFYAVFALSPASPEVEMLAQGYLEIRVLGAPAAIAVYGISGWLVGQGRTGALLLLQISVNGLNILLDCWFVLGLSWGVSGVALATLAAEYFGLLFGLWLVRDGFKSGLWRNWARVFDGVKLRRMALVNRDIMLRSMLLTGGFVLFSFLGSSFSNEILAANQILLQFLHVTAYALDGFALAAETLVGQAVGARNRLGLRRAVWLTGMWGGISVSLSALGFAVLGGLLIQEMTTSLAVQDVALRYLPWMVLAPLTGVLAWMMDGVFIGATRTREMRDMMCISFCGFLISLWITIPMWGNHGLWFSINILFILRGITLLWCYPNIERDLS
ncbi:MATE family efflux transporter [Amylibacter marinus]|uniref:MATE family efflux transporter n=1 Tax=Amylibacter marinus TaxID=1475483 RepID=A0ABQ5VU42_9RHOB|nr:MATE family efflux transporter [Amylibacter marinus]GLQ34955.1 MATE family efflux transporter [Amylibacter marinus]